MAAACASRRDCRGDCRNAPTSNSADPHHGMERLDSRIRFPRFPFPHVPMSDPAATDPAFVDYLNGPDVAALALDDDEIVAAVEAGLAAQGRGETVIEPRVHLAPDAVVQRTLQRAARLRRAARARRRQGRRRLRRQLAPRPALRDGPAQPVRSAHRAPARDHRRRRAHRHAHRRRHRDRRQAPCAEDRAACSATSARAAPPTGTSACSIGCSGSTRFACTRAAPESRDAFAERLARDLGKPVVATTDWESCVRGADIVVEASRLPAPAPLLETAWIARGALVVPYGTMSAVELSLTDIMDKIVVDDWGQCKDRAVRQPARARRGRQAHGGDAPRGAGRDRRREEAGPRARRRDDPALAPRAVDVGHRARRTRCSRRRSASGIGTRLSAMRDGQRLAQAMIANARMYAIGAGGARRGGRCSNGSSRAPV